MKPSRLLLAACLALTAGCAHKREMLAPEPPQLLSDCSAREQQCGGGDIPDGEKFVSETAGPARLLIPEFPERAAAARPAGAVSAGKPPQTGEQDRLARRISRDTGRVLDAPPGYFAVQIAAGRSAEKLDALRRQLGLKGGLQVPVTRDNEIWYVLLLGLFETESAARNVLGHLSGGMAERRPWIRSVAGLQPLVRAASRQLNPVD